MEEEAEQGHYKKRPTGERGEENHEEEEEDKCSPPRSFSPSFPWPSQLLSFSSVTSHLFHPTSKLNLLIPLRNVSEQKSRRSPRQKEEKEDKEDEDRE